MGTSISTAVNIRLRAARGNEPGRRLLLLSYHFPPTESAGALRWEKLAPFAAARGIALDVVTHLPGELLEPGRRRLDCLPAATSVTGVPERPLVSDQLENWLAARLRRQPRPTASAPVTGADRAIPRRPDSLAPEEIGWSLEPRALLRAWWYTQAWRRDRQWARDAAAAGGACLTPSHWAVVTCGPPHQIHLAGSRLARRRRLPHVMDLRDPWGHRRRLPETLATPLAFALSRPAERESIEHAALVVANTPALRDALRRSHPGARDKMIAVMNGYDDEPLPALRPRDRFVVAYAGSVYLDRTPKPVFQAVAKLAATHLITPEDFTVEFLGPSADGARTVEREAAEAGVDRFVRVLPRLPRAAALEFLTGATVLLSLPQDSEFAIPSKLFEYLTFDAWILALATPESPSAQVFGQTGVAIVDPADPDRIADVLGAWLTAFRRGERPGPVSGRERLSRAHQASLLFDAIERIAVPETG